MRQCIKFLCLISILLQNFDSEGQHSIARDWNETLLTGIRNDLARPTVHARNLFHVSMAMYDAWAVFDQRATTYLIGKNVHDFYTPFEGFTTSENETEALEKAISYAAYRVMKHRFLFSSPIILDKLDSMMTAHGYDPSFTDSDYKSGNSAALGNYIGEAVIAYGLQDGSNEIYDYRNDYYSPINDGLDPTEPGNPTLVDPNRWQPLLLENFIDQGGNEVPGGERSFLSPEWGNVLPFALTSKQLTEYKRLSNTYNVYMDPGAPPYIDITSNAETNDLYKWNFELVAIWSGHLDASKNVLIDISPASKGNISSYPTSQEEFPEFYNLFEGATQDKGHSINPVTNAPYEAQMVPLGDYARVLAEFWADGPASETPPGHWFTIMNYVNDHPLLVKKWQGEGEIVDNLEWDIKSYFTLGSAMHDAAVTAWGVKGWYDYLRPISAIRWLADHGQSSDPNLDNYDPLGIRLYPGYIELVKEGDSLANIDPNNIGKIKIYAWKGPDFIDNEDTDVAGVDWILAENWWPYQRPTFVTPPFAGYISGHSTFSRTAAEILTQITGSKFFPGGLGEFHAGKNEFLVFEDGPSQDLMLQWATYQDASDETSLSRIWGGIHPPADDIPGRLIGIELGPLVFEKASNYFEGILLEAVIQDEHVRIYPNPVKRGQNISIQLPNQYSTGIASISIIDSSGKKVLSHLNKNAREGLITIDVISLSSGIYTIIIHSKKGTYRTKLKVE